MNLLLNAWTLGPILALLALGVFISFRVFSFPDMTAEGSITLGGAAAAALILAGWHPLTATLVAMLAGAASGAVTGILNTRFRINALLSGILMMTALYSVNLWIMGRSNLPLSNVPTLVSWAAGLAGSTDTRATVMLLGSPVAPGDLCVIAFTLVAVVLVTAVLHAFFGTQIGTAMRATGDNPQMIRALGASDGHMLVAGLALSNGLIALAGALLAQYQGFADVQMGIGMLVLGLAAVIIGESLVRTNRFGYLLIGAVLGSILFRLMVAVALRLGLDPNYLKLLTAVFVFAALILPDVLARLRTPRTESGHA